MITPGAASTYDEKHQLFVTTKANLHSQGRESPAWEYRQNIQFNMQQFWAGMHNGIVASIALPPGGLWSLKFLDWEEVEFESELR